MRPTIRREHKSCKLAIDLCCGAGGTSMGLWQAGYEVVGIDINPQPNYPFQFIQMDALEIDPSWLGEVADAVSIAPPCQGYSVTRNQHGRTHPLLIDPLRDIALTSGLPYILENVEGARESMRDPILLCGSSFGLRVRRHRLIESNVPLESIPCDHGWQDYNPCYKVYVSPGRSHGRGYKRTGVMPVFGGNHLVGGNSHFHGSVAMGIHWMEYNELTEAIPPAYGLHIGRQLMKYTR